MLETILTGRNLLSPMLATASRDVQAFNTQVTRANAQSAASGTAAAASQQTSAAAVEAAQAKVAASAKAGAATQSAASKAVIASNIAGADAAAIAAAVVAAANGEAATAAGEASESQQASFSDVQEKASEYAEKIKGAHAGAATSAAEGATATTAANTRSATSAVQSSTTQVGAGERVVASNTTTTVSTTTSSSRQMAAHRATATSATLSARAQEAANAQLATSNGLVAASMTPLLKGLGVVALALGYAGYRGMEFESSMSQVQAASQASAADLGLMRDAAIDAGAKTQYSAVEAAQGITEMSKAGVSAKDILAGGLAGALNLAAAGQMEVADAAETGATALSVFNLKGDQMSHVADLLAAGAGKAQGTVHDLSQALNQSALVANQTGLSIEDTAGALAMFAYNGLVGSDAGTSFKTMLQALTPNSVAASKAMDAIGFSAYDSQGKFVGLESVAGQLKTGLAGLTEEQRNSTLETIFGSDAVRAASVLYSEGAQGVDEWAGKVNDAGYAAKQAAQLTDNLGGDLERLGGAFDSAMTTIGGGTQGALREAVQALTAVVNAGGDVIGFFTSLPGPVQAGVVAFAGLAALSGPLGVMFGRLAVGITSAVTGLGMATGATSGWTLALGAARVGVVSLISAAAPLAALVATAYAVKQVVEFGSVTDDARDSVEALGDSVQALPVGDQIRTYREEIERLQDQIDSVEGQNAFDKYVWHNPFGNEAKDVAVAREKIEQLNGAIKGLEDDTPNAMEAVAAAVRGAVETTVTQSEEAAKALEDWRNEVANISSSFAEPLAIYTDMLAAKNGAESNAASTTKAMTESGAASWNEYAEDVGISLDQYATKLEEHILAQENWRANIVAVTQRGGLEVGQALLAMGEEGALITAQMADATDAEFRRMADLMIRDTQAGGAGAATALDEQMKVMAAVGAAGANATVQGIAQQLGIGANIVRDIAGRYGVNLAEGINPLLGALGKPQVRFGGRGMPEYAEGGYTGDGGKYEPKGVVHAGEFVITKERTAKLGVRTLENLEKILPGYAGGGFVSAADVPRPPSTAPYGPPISTAGDAAMDTVYQATTKWMQETGPFGQALAFARSQVGKPYIWGGVGPGGYDCSGFMSAITNVLRGRAPHSRVGATATFPWAGFAPGDGVFTVGSTPNAGGGIGHMAGTLMGVNVESRGGQGVVVGPNARGANNGLFSTRAHLTFDRGGMADGVGYLPKATVAPERVLDARQTAAFEDWMRSPAAMPGYGAAASGGSFGGSVVVVNIEGAQITGTLGFDAGGLLRLVDGRVVTAVTTITEQGRYNG